MKRLLILLVAIAGCSQPQIEPQYDYSESIEFVMNTAELVGWDYDHLTYQEDERSEILYIYADSETMASFRYAMWMQERNFHVIRFDTDQGMRYEIPRGVPCNLDEFCHHGNTIIDGELIIDNGLDRYGNAIER